MKTKEQTMLIVNSGYLGESDSGQKEKDEIMTNDVQPLYPLGVNDENDKELKKNKDCNCKIPALLPLGIEFNK